MIKAMSSRSQPPMSLLFDRVPYAGVAFACTSTYSKWKEARMTSRSFAQLMGVLFIFVGLLGFIPGMRSTPPITSPELIWDGGYGWLFGLFPVNWVHNLVHVAVGVAAWFSSTSAVSS